MDYTITELTDDNAIVIFADGAWANVPVLPEDTKAVFEKRVEGYVTRTTGANPAWIAVNQTGSVSQVAFTDPEPDWVKPDANPAWLDARLAAYGSNASQIEYITENGLDAWQTEVARIKTLHPQP